jgi:hypothetical protein
MKNLLAALVIVTIAICSTTSVNAQTYKPDWTTKVVLAGGGTDIVNTTTLLAPAAFTSSLTLPATVGGLNWVMTANGTGVMSWTNLATLGVTSVVGTAPVNVVTLAGVATVSLTTSNLTAAVGALTVTGGTGVLAGSTPASVALTTDVTLTQAGSSLGINLAHANTWTGDQTFPVDATQGNSLAASINAGTTLIGIAHGGTGQSTANAAFNALSPMTTVGDITYEGAGPAATRLGIGTVNQILSVSGGVPTWVSLSTLGVTSVLGTAPVVVNTVAGVATVSLTTSNLTASGAIGVTGGTGSLAGSTASAISLSVNSTLSQGASLGINLSNPNSWTGAQTFNGANTIVYTDGNQAAGKVLTSDVSGNASWQNAGASITLGPVTETSLVANTNNYSIVNSNQGVFYISSSAPINLTGIVAAAPGRLIVLVNNGANAITLTNEDALSTNVNRFHLQSASNIILGPDGTATLIYDGTLARWRTVANY